MSSLPKNPPTAVSPKLKNSTEDPAYEATPGQQIQGGKQAKEKAKATKDRFRASISRSFARMQYKQNSDYDWKDVESASLIEDATGHPEPWNVQQVSLSTSGITVKQYDGLYRRQINQKGRKKIDDPYPGWQVTFATSNISNIFCEEYEINSWRANAKGAKRSILVVRFDCTRAPEGQDCSEWPENEDDGDDEGEAMEVDRHQSAEFPLAKLIEDVPRRLVGTSIRLAFDTPPRNPGQTARSNFYPDVWAWPMVVSVLVGFPWKVIDDAESKAPLNAWAKGNKDRLPDVVLRERRAGTQIEWSVERKRDAPWLGDPASKPAKRSVKSQSSAFTLAAGEEQCPALPVPAAERPLPALLINRKRPVDAEPLESMDSEALQAEKARRQDEHIAAIERRVGLQKELGRAQKIENEKQKRLLAVQDEVKRRKN